MTVFFAMVIDALLGEPKAIWSRVPHPAVLIGRLIGWADETLNVAPGQRAKGVGLVIGLVLGAVVLGLILRAIPGQVVEVICLAILLAQRSLSDHVRAVARGLRFSTAAGKEAVAQIVGRDTVDMSDSDIARAAIESGAENLSDGVVAPLFWFVIGGLPGLFVYKAINTADSMVGYLTPRHADFGWASAKCDDLLNWVPARLTALLILLVTLRLDMIEEMAEDAANHRSPNAGWPEAAVAYAQNLALSGPRTYDGTLTDFPFVNPNGVRDLTPDHIGEVVGIMWRVWAALLVFPAIATIFQLL